MATQSFDGKYPRNPITEISIQIAPNFVPEFDSIFRIALTIKFENGKNRRTRGLNKGTKSWNKFYIKVSHGYFKDGKIHFNRAEVLKTGARFLTISVSPKGQKDFQRAIQIRIPILEKIFYSHHLSKKDIIHESSKNPVSRNDYNINSPNQLIIQEKKCHSSAFQKYHLQLYTLTFEA